ncbi:MBL fold metallo-hydrolase [Clostridium sp. WILCCON 0269]|uniref:MBL fold metallo-hydrolase n=1 Tax=Candidatus Clostridium eludens TaxID=3381663 RepID=A0ABW8SRB3_9CLOT
MRIADGIEMLEIPCNIMGRIANIYPVLIWDDKEMLLVDTGFPGQLEKFQEAVKKVGLPFERISKILLTHQDIDHVGSLASIVKELDGKVEVIAHEIEKQYITGEKTPIKLAQLEKNKDSLPDDRKGFYEILKGGFANAKANVDRTVVDCDVLPYCGGIKAIYTPGHTPGHICLYHRNSKTLIAGDEMNIEDGHLTGPNKMHTYDMGEAVKSLQKFARYDIQNIVSYHSGLYNDNANKAICELIESSRAHE